MIIRKCERKKSRLLQINKVGRKPAFTLFTAGEGDRAAAVFIGAVQPRRERQKLGDGDAAVGREYARAAALHQTVLIHGGGVGSVPATGAHVGKRPIVGERALKNSGGGDTLRVNGDTKKQGQRQKQGYDTVLHRFGLTFLRY